MSGRKARQPVDGAGEKVPSQRVRVLLVDDHPLVREGIRVSLESVDHIEIAGQAADGQEAVELALQCKPDIILMDITLPRLNGLEATKVLRRELPQSKVLILSVHDSREYVLEVMRAGASGYFLKDSSPQELIGAIEMLVQNREFFSPRISRVLSQTCIKLLDSMDKPRLDQLSEREKEVLAMVAQGFLNKEIARKLGVATRTVMTYRERLKRKLEIHNVAGLTQFAIANQIIDLP